MTDWTDGPVRVMVGDARERLAELPDESVDAVVTDPPYGLGAEPDIVELLSCWLAGKPFQSRGRGGFMGKEWDAFVPDPGLWREALRVLKPGGHALVFAGSRTADLMGIALRLAGFEIRDEIVWLYGSGFPKSLNVSKAIDRARNDDEAKWAVADWLRPHIERVGFNVVSAHFGFKGDTMVRSRWTSRSSTETPSWSQWLELKALCGFGDEMDAEVTRLNGRKGQPGEAWSERKVLERRQRAGPPPQPMWGTLQGGEWNVTAPATDAARQWDGWGTALKPAHEPICMARKPFRGRVAANVAEHGTGALNIDGCRIHTAGSEAREYRVTRLKPGATLNATGGNWRPEEGGVEYRGRTAAGRWPANLVLGHGEGCRPVGTRSVASNWREHKGAGMEYRGSDSQQNVARGHRDADGQETVEAWECEPGCPVAELNRQSGTLTSGFMAAGTRREGRGYRGALGTTVRNDTWGDQGGASRFFYVAKASARERNAGMPAGTRNTHPTVKPIALMRWLCRLVTPPGGLVLDPFMGSGTTGIAAALEGFRFIGIDSGAEPNAVEIAVHRLRHWRAQATTTSPSAAAAAVVLPRDDDGQMELLDVAAGGGP